MMVACVLVNRASWDVAEPIMAKLRRRWRTIEALSLADKAQLSRLLRPLGFQRRRRHSLIALAATWRLFGRPRRSEDVPKYPGLGPYARDSWAMFVEGRRDVEPRDGRLAWHLDQLKRRAR